MTKEYEITKKEMLEYRRNNFEIKVYTKVEFPKGSIELPFSEENEIILSTSTNGRQFQSISLLPEEVDKVIEALIPHAKADKIMEALVPYTSYSYLRKISEIYNNYINPHKNEQSTTNS